MKKIKALIIGGAGFVGDYLINHLVDDINWDVSVTKMSMETLNNDKAEIYDLDILDKGQINAVLEKVRPKSIGF